ncbi:MAG: DNA-3-methyladenine glycosylase I [Bacteroidota bacterium]|nr:DNA-3-methyladenine glycosylase I [Bacteroidota bacterium]
MENTNSYCAFVRHLDKEHLHKIYHDTQYGFPLSDDNELFGRLILEINQAGLSWLTILKKEQNFRIAYANFDVNLVSKFNDDDISRLLLDKGIIRNKLKINAIIFNAQVIITIQKKYGSFKKWLDFNHPKERKEWVKLFKKTFKFTGGEITNEFLMSTGYLEGAHEKSCPIYKKLNT